MDDTARYPWQVDVAAFSGPKPFRVGVQDGNVVGQPPPFGGFSMDPDTADQLAAMLKAAAARARAHRQVSGR